MDVVVAILNLQLLFVLLFLHVEMSPADVSIRISSSSLALENQIIMGVFPVAQPHIDIAPPFICLACLSKFFNGFSQCFDRFISEPFHHLVRGPFKRPAQQFYRPLVRSLLLPGSSFTPSRLRCFLKWQSARYSEDAGPHCQAFLSPGRPSAEQCS